eukprot:GCRY01001209.1.p1 GENE.GCRY01001209.1~~GCRY01001209.1.p1  ORF type:complete len:859 (-),score=208.84 GCRY01001209.1:527-3103(-)
METPKETPTAIKKTVSACDRCRNRKVKCDGQLPCSRCAAAGVYCVYSQQKRRGAKKKTKFEADVAAADQELIQSPACAALLDIFFSYIEPFFGVVSNDIRNPEKLSSNKSLIIQHHAAVAMAARARGVLDLRQKCLARSQSLVGEIAESFEVESAVALMLLGFNHLDLNRRAFRYASLALLIIEDIEFYGGKELEEKRIPIERVRSQCLHIRCIAANLLPVHIRDKWRKKDFEKTDGGRTLSQSAEIDPRNENEANVLMFTQNHTDVWKIAGEVGVCCMSEFLHSALTLKDKLIKEPVPPEPTAAPAEPRPKSQASSPLCDSGSPTQSTCSTDEPATKKRVRENGVGIRVIPESRGGMEAGCAGGSVAAPATGKGCLGIPSKSLCTYSTDPVSPAIRQRYYTLLQQLDQAEHKIQEQITLSPMAFVAQIEIAVLRGMIYYRLQDRTQALANCEAVLSHANHVLLEYTPIGTIFFLLHCAEVLYRLKVSSKLARVCQVIKRLSNVFEVAQKGFYVYMNKLKQLLEEEAQHTRIETPASSLGEDSGDESETASQDGPESPTLAQHLRATGPTGNALPSSGPSQLSPVLIQGSTALSGSVPVGGASTTFGHIAPPSFNPSPQTRSPAPVAPVTPLPQGFSQFQIPPNQNQHPQEHQQQQQQQSPVTKPSPVALTQQTALPVLSNSSPCLKNSDGGYVFPPQQQQQQSEPAPATFASPSSLLPPLPAACDAPPPAGHCSNPLSMFMDIATLHNTPTRTPEDQNIDPAAVESDLQNYLENSELAARGYSDSKAHLPSLGFGYMGGGIGLGLDGADYTSSQFFSNAFPIPGMTTDMFTSPDFIPLASPSSGERKDDSGSASIFF